jgi:NADPH-dependent 2,4-dienoyl-CoA reductase/sulfur reductase-like enzyme
LADGTEVPADAIVIGIGGVPTIEWLRTSGLPLGDGLLCDEFSTAAPGVHGVGDVARWHNPLFDVSMRIEHRTNAAEQGLAVARNLLGARQPFASRSPPAARRSPTSARRSGRRLARRSPPAPSGWTIGPLAAGARLGPSAKAKP